MPQHCTIYYRTLKSGPGVRGERGSVTMSNYRDTTAQRNFWFDGKPFKGVLSTIEFDVFGYDHRASGYKLDVVDSPAVVETLLDVVYPKYMVDEATSSHLPGRKSTLSARGDVPPRRHAGHVEVQGQQAVARGPDRAVRWRRAHDDRHSRQCQGPQSFGYRIDSLKGSVSLEVLLLDADNVATERPFRVFLTAIEDQPPQVEVSLKGIGSAVTPDVTIPIRGKISDDYGIQKTWSDVQVNDRGDERDRPFGLGKGGAVEQQIDFRHERTEKTGLEIKPGDKLFLAVKAADKFDLAGEPHVATGDRYTLDVVTPEELLAQLEVREIGLRRRFELIIDEMTQLRDSLLRVKASLAPRRGERHGAGGSPLR